MAVVRLGPRIPPRRRLPRATAGLQLGIAEIAGVAPAGLRLVGPRPAPFVARTLAWSGKPTRRLGTAIRFKLPTPGGWPPPFARGGNDCVCRDETGTPFRERR